MVAFLLMVATATAQVPTTINYQGRLLDGTNLYNGPAQLKFNLYTSETSVVQIYQSTAQVSVLDGLYATQIGAFETLGTLGAALTNQPLFLEVVVNDLALTPRERLASVGYALLARSVATGAVGNAQIAANAGIDPTKLGGGAVSATELSYLDGVTFPIQTQLSGEATTRAGADSSLSNAVAQRWSLEGNSATVPGTHFIGTTDNQPLEFRVGNLRAGLVVPAGGEPNIILGAAQNVISNGSSGSVVLGGIGQVIDAASDYSAIGGGLINRVLGSDRSVIAGGSDNIVQGDNSAFAFGHTIGGGLNNIIWGSQGVRILAPGGVGTIAGGNVNTIETNADFVAIGGGLRNTVGTNADYSVIIGGASNQVLTGAQFSVVAGGANNRVLSGAQYSFVAGGQGNAAAQHGFAAGRRAKANHEGTFVWADAQNADFASSGTNEFLIRASGGVGINTTNPEAELHVARGSAGSVTANSTALLALENSTNVFIHLLVPTNATSGILFGDPASSLRSSIRVNNNGGQEMTFRVGDNTPKMSIASNGLVGIGTTSPGADLHVVRAGSGVAPNSSALLALENSTNGFIHLLVPTNATSGILFGDPANALRSSIRVNNNGGQEMTFRVGDNTTKMSISSDGKVGIGTTSADEKLEVVGNVLADSLVVRKTVEFPVGGTTIVPQSGYIQLEPASNLTLSAAFAIFPGQREGQMLILQGDNVFSTTLLDGANVSLGAATRVIGSRDILTLIWEGTEWVEVSFSNK